MKVTDHLRNANGKTLFSIEILPPLKGKGMTDIYKAIDPLIEFKPSFIDVTYHREEYVYKKRNDGLLEKKSVRKRPGTVGICAGIMTKYNVDAVPHIICGGFSKDETENALIDLSFLGIDNVLLLRGDSIKSEGSFKPEPNGNAYALDLVEQVVNMNRGVYLDDELEDVSSTNFCIGIAGYPEKHFEAPNLKTDLKYLKAKVDAGADYIVTQMFYDNSKYFEFVDLCRENGINVPIIPGIKIMTTKKQLNILPSVFHIDIPDALAEAVEKAKTSDQVKEIGVEWAIQQCKELVAAKVPCLHFYTMGNPDTCKRVAEKVL
ncbi:MAG TPA: methylenetetrahydrofolate reductase [NAD(P)H] [Bacteroidia bacterium]|jgi:methylenetetrahydrofolate reductase (NADPH)|nr:methylenetetrahydrofolate reductase [NAD(P)H] [Bacteroidia bacterium]HQF29091.1 methylenetetrahydrofolate reductase [NAD(P)H] [Bacteroidia bacterium]HQK97585.1 methylenetetrahydrofolate reductase [NAD(P)H] [Bacteroidia bacterium]